MKHSSTHVLGLLLAAAAATAAPVDPHFDHHHNGVRGPAPSHGAHDHDLRHDAEHFRPRHGDNAHTHGMLEKHLLGTGMPEAVGLEDDRGAELLHPITHYMPAFFSWTFKYGQEWASVKEASHALRVSELCLVMLLVVGACDCGIGLGFGSLPSVSMGWVLDPYQVDAGG